MSDSYAELQRLLLAKILDRLARLTDGLILDRQTLAAADAAADALMDSRCGPRAVLRALERFTAACHANHAADRPDGYHDTDETDRLDAARELLARLAAAMTELCVALPANRPDAFLRHLGEFDRATDALCELCDELDPAF